MTTRPLPPADDHGDTVVGDPSARTVPPARSADQARVPSAAPPVGHEVTVVDLTRFAQARCSCGWQGAARRARGSARTEARDHALLFADPGAVSPGRP